MFSFFKSKPPKTPAPVTVINENAIFTAKEQVARFELALKQATDPKKIKELKSWLIYYRYVACAPVPIKDEN